MAGLHALDVRARLARLLGNGVKEGLRRTSIGSGSAQFSPAEPSSQLPPNRGIKVFGAPISSAIGLIARALVEPFERRMRRERALTRLMALSDHQLRDIGLARLDIQAAAMGIYGAPGYEMISPDLALDEETGPPAPRVQPQTVRSLRPMATSVPVTAKRRSTGRLRHRAGAARIAHLRPKTVSVVAAGRRS